MSAAASTAMALKQPLRRQLRRPLLGSLAILAVSLVAWNCAGAFVGQTGARTDLSEGRRGGLSQSPNLRSTHGTFVARRAAEEQKSQEEMSDMELLFDRFNNRGGAILAIIGLTVIGVGLERFLEVVGVESMTAGIYVSAIYFVLMLAWVSTYVFRVFTKGTTYAEQLQRYEQAVMVKRLQELDEDEIEALCEEVGISRDDIDSALGGVAEGASQKEAVIELFKSTQVGNKKEQKDPRDFFGGFGSNSRGGGGAAAAPEAEKSSEPAKTA
eukprot:TRINITY_DN22709_c0_g1_i1.p1 TRINITY_DN22709_c0_g1~~TRINITY_DN22709_c0_g1_i1.p1  ORF type:complete len:270 (+),score=114.28 TRINITY_DN22709_c0_g1_i1:71-880(+)